MLDQQRYEEIKAEADRLFYFDQKAKTVSEQFHDSFSAPSQAAYLASLDPEECAEYRARRDAEYSAIHGEC